MGRKPGLKSNGLEQKEEINIQPEQNEETIQKNEKRPRNFQDIFKHSNIWIIAVTEGEEEEIENLFEQIIFQIPLPIWKRKQTSRKSRKLRESWRN